MEEMTFIEPEYQLEFMVNVDTKNHKVIDCYTYVNDIDELRKSDRYYGEINELINRKWKVGHNALFGHNRNAFKAIAKFCVYSPENEQAWDLAHEVMTANDIVQFEILEP